MDYKKTTAPTNTKTRDIMNLCEETGNISVAHRGHLYTRLSSTDLEKRLSALETI